MVPGLRVQDVVILRAETVEVEIVYQRTVGNELALCTLGVRGWQEPPAERRPVLRFMGERLASQIPVLFDDVDDAGDFPLRFARPFVERAGAHLEAVGTNAAVQQQRMAVAGAFNDSVVSVAPIFWVLLGLGAGINIMLSEKAVAKKNMAALEEQNVKGRVK